MKDRFISIYSFLGLVFIAIVLFVLAITINNAFAGELEEKRARLSAVEWEFRYCNERMQNLNQLAQKLQREIKEKEAQLANKEKEEEEAKETDE